MPEPGTRIGRLPFDLRVFQRGGHIAPIDGRLQDEERRRHHAVESWIPRTAPPSRVREVEGMPNPWVDPAFGAHTALRSILSMDAGATVAAVYRRTMRLPSPTFWKSMHQWSPFASRETDGWAPRVMATANLDIGA